MAGMRLTYSYQPGDFLQSMQGVQNKMAKAATGAIREAATLAKSAARQAIAAGGFGTKWQGALRANVYPPTGNSLNPAALIYSKIPYSSVFEAGATITGKMWLPIEKNLPTGRGGRSWTPQQYAAQVGPLVSVNRPGHPPMLFGLIKVSKRGKVLRGSRGQRDLGAPTAGTTKLLPLFVGVSSVTDPKKFDAIAAIRAVGDRIPDLYRKNLES